MVSAPECARRPRSLSWLRLTGKGPVAFVCTQILRSFLFRRVRPVELLLTSRSQVTVGETTILHVAVVDEFANPATSFEGRVEVTAESGEAEFEKIVRLSAGRGWGEVTFTPKSAGLIRFKAWESSRSLEGRSNPVEVFQNRPEQSLYWGDIHSHTQFSIADAVGNPSDAYEYARRISGLDFYAMTDHSRGECRPIRHGLCSSDWSDYFQLADRYHSPWPFRDTACIRSLVLRTIRASQRLFPKQARPIAESRRRVATRALEGLEGRGGVDRSSPYALARIFNLMFDIPTFQRP